MRTFHRTTSVFLLALGLLAASVSPVAADTASTGVTRAYGAVALWQFAGSPTGPFDDPGFADVPVGMPDRTAIGWLAATGVTVGRSDGTFGVDAPLSRAALASMLYRFAGSPDGPYAVTPFNDVNPAGTHGVAIGWLWDTGLTFGLTKDRFGPFRPVSQSQLEAFLQRFGAALNVTISLPPAAAPAPVAPLGAFSLADNGVTVLCPDAAVGDTGVVNGVTFTKRTREQIIADRGSAGSTCTSGIADMSSMFSNAGTFNEPIGHWDTSDATTMRFMFFSAGAFNTNISHWDTSSVTDMTGMFENANAFNQDLSGWHVTQFATKPTGFDVGTHAGFTTARQPQWGFGLAANGVTVICPQAPTFATGVVNGVLYTKRIKAHINDGNAALTCTSGITDMSFMFAGSATFDGDISHWDTSTVTNMRYMFRGAFEDEGSVLIGSVFDRPIGAWDTSSVTDMQFMFYGATTFNQDIGNWDTGKVTTLRYTFADAAAFNQNIGGWDTTKVTDMERTFERAAAFNQNIGNWNTSIVTDMFGMFRFASAFNQDLSGWCVSQFAPPGPGVFDGSADAWTLPKPVWGTCP